MSVQAAESFYEKLVSDQSFRRQIVSAGDADAVLEKAQAAGFDFAPDEMKDVLAKDKGARSFTDDELDSIASGDTSGWVGAGAGGVGAAVAAGAAAAACV
jgi:predicted ribosomally synthesized peptide with nif11-like leader